MNGTVDHTSFSHIMGKIISFFIFPVFLNKQTYRCQLNHTFISGMATRTQVHNRQQLCGSMQNKPETADNTANTAKQTLSCCWDCRSMLHQTNSEKLSEKHASAITNIWCLKLEYSSTCCVNYDTWPKMKASSVTETSYLHSCTICTWNVETDCDTTTSIVCHVADTVCCGKKSTSM